MPLSQDPPVSPPTGPAGLSTKFIAVAVMVVLVLVSAVAGAAVDRLVIRPSSVSRAGSPPPWASGGPGGGAMNRGPGGNRGGTSLRPFDQHLRGALALSEVQRDAIDSALASQYRDFDAARRTIQPHLDSIIQATRVRIDAILTPEQRAALPASPEPMGGPGMRGGGMRGSPPGSPRWRDRDDTEERRRDGPPQTGGPSHNRPRGS